LRPIGGGAEVVGFANGDESDAVGAGEADGVVAAMEGDDLADAVFAVVECAASGFVDEAAGGVEVDVSVLDSFDVDVKELDSVGVDAAEVGGDEGVGDEIGVGGGVPAAAMREAKGRRVAAGMRIPGSWEGCTSLRLAQLLVWWGGGGLAGLQLQLEGGGGGCRVKSC
jgi:hypothetical protein